MQGWVKGWLIVGMWLLAGTAQAATLPSATDLIVAQAKTRIFTVKESAAVQQMDAWLAMVAGPGVRVDAARQAQVRSYLHLASWLVANGYGIAGQVVLTDARTLPGFADDKVANATYRLVMNLTAPVPEDAEWAAAGQRLKAGTDRIQSLPLLPRRYASWIVYGTVFHDAVAVQAGWAGLRAIKAPLPWQTRIRAAATAAKGGVHE